MFARNRGKALLLPFRLGLLPSWANKTSTKKNRVFALIFICLQNKYFPSQNKKIYLLFLGSKLKPTFGENFPGRNHQSRVDCSPNPIVNAFFRFLVHFLLLRWNPVNRCHDIVDQNSVRIKRNIMQFIILPTEFDYSYFLKTYRKNGETRINQWSARMIDCMWMFYFNFQLYFFAFIDIFYAFGKIFLIFSHSKRDSTFVVFNQFLPKLFFQQCRMLCYLKQGII